jgi:hypothetical protein
MIRHTLVDMGHKPYLPFQWNIYLSDEEEPECDEQKELGLNTVYIKIPKVN